MSAVPLPALSFEDDPRISSTGAAERPGVGARSDLPRRLAHGAVLEGDLEAFNVDTDRTSRLPPWRSSRADWTCSVVTGAASWAFAHMFTGVQASMAALIGIDFTHLNRKVRIQYVSTSSGRTPSVLAIRSSVSA